MTQAVYVKLSDAVVKFSDPLEAALAKLGEIRKAREAEVKRLGLISKARSVASCLGVEFGKAHGSYWVWPKVTLDEWRSKSFAELSRKYGLLVVLDDYVGAVHVWVDGEEVLGYDGDRLTKYVPGAWVHEVLRLADKAEYVQAVRETEAKLKEILEECERWGVDPSELLTQEVDDLGV